MTAVTAVIIAPVGIAPAGAADGRVIFHLHARRLDEISGIAPGQVSPGVDYVQNDSGDSNRFFAVNAATGRLAATITVPGATNVDWEDIAAAPDAAGVPSVWLADIGDNQARRAEIDVYRVAEPRVRADDHDRALTSGRPDVWRLRYPNGPSDAESFAVTPDGVGYLVTKSIIGASVVYRLPPRPDPRRVQTLSRVGAIHFVPTGSPGPFGLVGQLTATGAAISRDGRLLAVRTYSDAYLWRLSGDDVARALTARPTRVALPVEPQGEGIAIDGSHLLVDSEGVGSPVYAVPIPVALRSPSRHRASSPAPSRASRPPVSRPAAPIGAATRPGSDEGWLRWVIVGAVVGGLAAAAGVAARSRRRERG